MIFNENNEEAKVFGKRRADGLALTTEIGVILLESRAKRAK